ncbi:MAG TPA: hypothetical protein VF282_02615 [Bacillota bacterium]
MSSPQPDAAATPAGGTFEPYLVLKQMEPRGPFESEYTVLAPNPEMALVLAQENFMRRQEAPVNLMVVRQRDLHLLPEDRRQALARTMPRDYRTVPSYAHVARRWQELKVAAGGGTGTGGRRGEDDADDRLAAGDDC